MCQTINCYHCEEDKDIAEYRPSKIKLHLGRGICISCCKIQNAENREKDKAKRAAGISYPKKCSSCGETKDSIKDFSPRASQCKECRHKKSVAEADERNRIGREKRGEERLRKYQEGLLNGTIPKEGYKFCRKCGGEKLLEEFVSVTAPIRIKKMSTHATCKECRKKNTLETWLSLSEIECNTCGKTKPQHQFVKSKYRCKACDAEWRQLEENKQKASEYAKQHYKKPEVKIARNATRRAYRKIKRATDPRFVIEKTLRDRLYQLVKKDVAVKHDRAVNLVGCTIEQLVAHLESHWEPMMDWTNYGKPKYDGHKTWTVDHVIPCRAYNLLELDRQKECFHWENLRPVWDNDNSKKNDKVEINGVLISARKINVEEQDVLDYRQTEHK